MAEYQMDVFEVVQGKGIRARKVWNYEFCDNFHYQETLEQARSKVSQKPRVKLADVQRAKALPTDDFQGNTPYLVSCIAAYLQLDEKGALVPNGISSHGRTLLSAAASRLSASDIDYSGAYAAVNNSFLNLERICISHGYDYSQFLSVWLENKLAAQAQKAGE